MLHSKRSAIALMVTLIFIIAISVSLGISLKMVKDVKTEVTKQKFAMQSNIIVTDIIAMLDGFSTEINSAQKLFIFLQQYGELPLEINGIMVHISIKSARAKINLNMLKNNSTVNNNFKHSLGQYFGSYGINSVYLDMLIDNVSGIKKDDSYNSDIFTYKPYLFRDYITSYKHLKEINNFYTIMNNDNSLSRINFEELFYFSKDTNTTLDVNYISTDTWRLLLNCDEARASELSLGAGQYEKKADLKLTPLELESFNNLNIDSYFGRFLDVEITLNNGALSSKIRFEYNAEKKRVSNFVYNI
jgi:hypothetical protein